VRLLRLVAGLTVIAAVAAPAQLAITQPTEKLLLIPLRAHTIPDSAASVAFTDATRERLNQLARYKAIIIPKAKLCEALQASGFQCDVLLDDKQGQQLANFMRADALVSGELVHGGSSYTAHVRVKDLGGSGYAGAISVSGAAPTALADTLADRLNALIRAGEQVRECDTQRQHGNFPRAVDAARKALSNYPTAVGAYLCMELVYEAEHFPPESLLAVSDRAIGVDSLNPAAWQVKASVYQQKGDTVKMIDAGRHILAADPTKSQYRMGLTLVMLHARQYEAARALLDSGLAMTPNDGQMLDLKERVCTEGTLYRCLVDVLAQKATADSALLTDTTFLKKAIGAAQSLPDTQASLRFTKAAVIHFPKSADFWKTRGGAFQTAGMADSATAAYKVAIGLDPTDMKSTLLVAQSILDACAWDTAKARAWSASKDTSSLHAAQSVYAGCVDGAHTYVDRALASPDTLSRWQGTLVSLSAGQKLVAAGAFEAGYNWLDRVIQESAPRSSADTVGPRMQVRVNASFLYGIASVQTLAGPYRDVAKSKSCAKAKDFNDRLVRTEQALTLGMRVRAQTAQQFLGFLNQYMSQMPKVKGAFKCSNF